jgi:hypothetical protein
MKIAVLTPVFDDWPAFARLLQEISGLATDLPFTLEIVAVDDGSSVSYEQCSPALTADASCEVEILRLGLNLGHQRAIAVGLVEIARRGDLEGVFVMDCDGEDRPADLPRLFAASRDYPGRIIVAQRVHRSERQAFKAGYAFYKFFFALLTGQHINFGNFCFMPMACVRRLVFMPEIWNNLPATILRSSIGHFPVATARGSRYSGRSRMNWAALIAHGLSAMSVYIDIVFVRILVGALIVAAITLIGIAVAVAIRFATSLAIPGWTTIVVGVLGLLLMQVAVMVIPMLLLVLAARNTRPIVPLVDASVFLAARRRYQSNNATPWRNAD